MHSPSDRLRRLWVGTAPPILYLGLISQRDRHRARERERDRIPTEERAQVQRRREMPGVPELCGSGLILVLLLVSGGLSPDPGEPEPGCQLYPFNLTIKSDRRGTCRGSQLIQACVGYCESSAFPSKYSVLKASGFKHNITSVSQCCTISKMQKVRVRLSCGNRREEIEIFTAKSCRCDMCRLSRY
ncbi:glycoprotein hormone alpha-2 [Scyliorhinus canicula]|uniref:glycoprotein hormone alpha-2 n=1 Tax=Scyliorhinus canicula TaxID=7830 RepID=UPI0018F322E3|nr:glycoprotein hormone alpha-2 [Scyliorhinus canicula]